MGFEQYLDAIERRLGRERGLEWRLSPPDFRLARQWFLADFELANVLAGIDATSNGREPLRTLRACRRAVEALCASGNSAGRAAPWTATAAPDAVRLNDLAQRLASLATERPAFGGAAARARDLLSLPGVHPAVLDQLRQQVEELSLSALGVEERERLTGAAQRRLERQGAHLAADERSAALQRHLVRRALERLGLAGLV